MISFKSRSLALFELLTMHYMAITDQPRSPVFLVIKKAARSLVIKATVDGDFCIVDRANHRCHARSKLSFNGSLNIDALPLVNRGKFWSFCQAHVHL